MDHASRRAWILVVIALAIAGTALRLAPLFSDDRTVAAISEDGYLMLTVARNMAAGQGLSIADGTVPTNGVQPLVTVIWAGLHWLVDGARLPALRLVVLTELLFSLVTTVLVWRLVADVFPASPGRTVAALLAAALWFASPISLRHTTNGLETGAYALAIAATLLVDRRWQQRTVARALAFGGLLGLLFLVRNDAAFFIAAWLAIDLFGSHLVRFDDPRPFIVRVQHQVLSLLAALAVASPWLLYNLRVFGHIVPISGRAQNLNAPFGENLLSLPRALLEYAWMISPLPGFDRHVALAVLALILFGAAVVGTLWGGRRAGLQFPRWAAVLSLQGLLLAVYYGCFFGAPYFLSRYLFPLSLLMVLVPAVWLVTGWRTEKDGGNGSLVMVQGIVVIALIWTASSRLYLRGDVHPHGHVVQWVEANVPAEAWVGAPQSGTLGYFHDRTINLDGKVNPDALEARRDQRLFQYIVDDTPIEYLVDWYGLARWLDRPDTVDEERDPALLDRHFETLVKDPVANLVVLRRRPAGTASGRGSGL